MPASDEAQTSATQGRFVRVSPPRDHRPLAFRLDGSVAAAFEGDTVLVAILALRGFVRVHEFDNGSRAGFCLMGACQDCWVWTGDGRRLRACTTPLTDGLDVRTVAPGSAGAP